MADSWFVCQEENAAALLPKCLKFQEFCGEPDEANTIPHVYIEKVMRGDETFEYILPAELEAKRPFCLVYSENPSITRIAANGYGELRGELIFLFDIDHSEIVTRYSLLDDDRKRIQWCKDMLGQIMLELMNDHMPVIQDVYEMDWQSYNHSEATDEAAHILMMARCTFGIQ